MNGQLNDYTITRISSGPPKAWSFTDARTQQPVEMETYRVMFNGYPDPIEVNRKPGNPPKVGEMLTGTLSTTNWGIRFKPSKKPFPTRTWSDPAEIKAQWAIGQAISLFTSGKDEALADIEKNAKDFFRMVDRVKTGEASGYEKAKEVVEAIKAKKEVPSVVTEVFGVEESEPINLEDIPF